MGSTAKPHFTPGVEQEATWAPLTEVEVRGGDVLQRHSVFWSLVDGRMGAHHCTHIIHREIGSDAREVLVVDESHGRGFSPGCCFVAREHALRALQEELLGRQAYHERELALLRKSLASVEFELASHTGCVLAEDL